MHDADDGTMPVFEIGQPVRISRGLLTGVTGWVRQALCGGSCLLEIAPFASGVCCRISTDFLESNEGGQPPAQSDFDDGDKREPLPAEEVRREAPTRWVSLFSAGRSGNGDQTERCSWEMQMPLPPPIETLVLQRLKENDAYAPYFTSVRFQFLDGVLTLRGTIPTFHLKQMLQTSLRNLEGVKRIDNQVDVSGVTGLSSEPWTDLARDASTDHHD